MAKVIDAVISLRDEFSSKMKKAAEETSRFSKQIERTGRDVKKISKAYASTGAALTKGITLPLVGLAVGAGKAAIDFESAFAGVRKTVDATEEQFKMLEKGIILMSTKMPQSAAEIAGVAEAAGQLGIKTENILMFTETMVKLGDTTNMSSTDAATALARLANITGMPQTEFGKLGSTIVALGNNLATTESEIVEMGLRIAGAGNQVGMSEAQIMSFSGALSAVGINAEAGGSSFSKLMVQMQLASVKGGKDLKNFAKVSGMSAKDFSKLFKEDATKAITAFVGGLGKAESQGKSAIKILDDMGIKEVILRDTLLRAAGSSESFTNSIEIGTKAWEENNALNAEAEQRYKTTASQLEILKNNFINIGISLASEFLPYINAGIEKVKSLIDKFNGLSKEQKDMIIKIALFAATVGPTVFLIGKLGSSLGGAFISFSKFSKEAKKLGFLKAFLTPGKSFTIILLAIATIALLVINNWDKIVEVFNKAKKYIADTFGVSEEGAGKFLLSILGLIPAAILLIFNFKKVLGVFKLLGKGVKGGIDLFKKFGKATKNIKAPKFNMTKFKLPKLKIPKFDFSKIKTKLPKIDFSKAKIKKPSFNFSNVKVKLPKLNFKGMMGKLPKFNIPGSMFKLPKVKMPKLKMPKLKVPKLNFGSIISGAKDTGGALTNLKGLGNLAFKGLKGSWGIFKFAFKAIPVIGQILWIIDIISMLKSAWDNNFLGIRDITTKVWDCIISKVESIVGPLDGIKTKLNNFKEEVGKAWEGVKSFFKNPIQATVNFVKKGAENIKNIGKNALGTSYWRGGLTWVGEHGPELLNLPSGSEIIDNRNSKGVVANKEQQIMQIPRQGGRGEAKLSINKLADTIVVRQDSDIDKIAEALFAKIEKAGFNMA